GNITNNTIKYNNHFGINLSHNYYGSPNIIKMKINNNTITNNNWSGIFIRGGVFSGTQYSPMPKIFYNTITNNNHSGVQNYRALAYDLNENTIEYNNESGVFCESNSRPRIFNNHNISWNMNYGIESRSGSRPRVNENNITNNFDSGLFLGSGYNSQIYDNLIEYNLGHGVESIGANPNIHDNLITKNINSGVYVQGGTKSLAIRANDINYNSWNGVETNNSNCQITNNNLTNNSQNGIKLSSGSPGINSDNLVNYNTWNGLACYQRAQPFITKSEFKFNGKNGIFLDYASPRISAIAVKNKVMSNTMNGIACINGSSGVIFADVMSNILDGVYTADSGTDTEILNSMITNNGRNGVNATADSAPVISNSTITGNTGEAFWLDRSADPIALNDSYVDTDVWFEDTASTLTVKWHVFIKTESKATGAPVGNVKVWVNSTTQSQVAWTGRSDISGWIEWLRITEYIESDSNNNHRATEPGERTMWTTHDVSGDRRGYRETHVSPNPEINRSMTIVLELDSNRAPSGATNIKPVSTHNAHPTITWSPSTDLDGHSITYQVWVGPNINTSTIHESTDLITTNYPLPIDLDYN
ncbi:MAG: right-handed parallel beta-helix repeat-containing protein, partial [Thermoplasmata archaeon]|nr:right-handed parallel beta-helix repeat-containing protein [Thermoplasmata archaeon]